ncbi:hypothetical protein [Helicobacter sp. 13S00477-4]|uniref:hypothetical protein n=1 Tax=Helicobacter sp. 13S00477-4 TaxID=1905759 RepID=UPI000BA5934E|nr:hypothetical protein [Helicobacter sp. 13S00477-4]PAF50317.1 hypothetical protein BKH44_08465 [Helicobacter sp. 13S00477-4]
MASYVLDKKSIKCSYKDVINIDRINLVNYHNKNHKINDNVLKLKIILNLILIIRNRAFHWENLLKIGYAKKGYRIPKIYVKKNQSTNGIYPNKIKIFINDVLECFEEDMLEKYKIPFKGANGY